MAVDSYDNNTSLPSSHLSPRISPSSPHIPPLFPPRVRYKMSDKHFKILPGMVKVDEDSDDDE